MDDSRVRDEHVCADIALVTRQRHAGLPPPNERCRSPVSVDRVAVRC